MAVGDDNLTEAGTHVLDFSADGVDSPALCAEVQPLSVAPPDQNPLGQYELLGVLGKGGMGVVYLGRHRLLAKRVAVKVIQPALCREPSMVERFLREISAVGQIEHINIVRAFDAGQIDGQLFLALEFIRGANLETIRRAWTQMPVAEACDLIRQAACGLQSLHVAGLVHRDLKPSNLMLTTDGVVKIADLGLARLLQDRVNVSDEALTATGDLLGTFDFMAPEQAADPRSVDIRADLYSLGCTLFTLLAGRTLFAAPDYKTRGSKLVAHATVPAPDVRQFRSEVPIPLADLLRRLLSKSPADRISTPAELSERLREFSTGACCRVLFGIEDGRDLRSTIVQVAATETIHSPGVGATRVTSKPQGDEPEARPASRVASTPPRSVWKMYGGGAVAASAVLLTAQWLGFEWLPAQPENNHSAPEEAPATVNAAVAPQQISTRVGGVPFEPAEEWWSRALGKLPHEIAHPGIRGKGSVHFEVQHGIPTLIASTSDIRLIRLGVMSRLGGVIRLTFEPLGGKWDGFGIFLGHRLEFVDEDDTSVFQLISLTRSFDSGGAAVPTVDRTRSCISLSTGMPHALKELHHERVEEPSLSPRMTMQIEVRQNRLVSVKWCGTSLDHLVSEVAEENLVAADYEGEFGIYLEGGAVWCTDPEVTLFEEN